MQAIGAIGTGEIAGVANAPIDDKNVTVDRVRMNKLVVVVHLLRRSLPPFITKAKAISDALGLTGAK